MSSITLNIRKTSLNGAKSVGNSHSEDISPEVLRDPDEFTLRSQWLTLHPGIGQ